MSKRISIFLTVFFLLSAFVFSTVSTDYFWINTGSKKGKMTKTKTAQQGWLKVNGYESNPISTNVSTGTGIIYFSNSKNQAGIGVQSKDVSGNAKSWILRPTNPLSVSSITGNYTVTININGLDYKLLLSR